MSEGIKTATGPAAGAPWWVTIFTPVTRSVLGTRIPMGFNGLITIRGRKSGLPRTTPIAIIQVSGRRWVWSPWGEVNWVRNLRAAGEAELEIGATRRRMRAVELTPEEGAAFFRNVIAPYVARLALPWRLGVRALIRFAAPEIQTDPYRAALAHPVFELVEEA